MMGKVIIAGSRTVEDYSELLTAISRAPFKIDEVVSGTAKGADQLGERWAKEQGLPIKRFKPDFHIWGQSAGYYRNMEMAAYAQALILVWDGLSAGSASMRRIARMLKMPYYEHIVKYDGF